MTTVIFIIGTIVLVLYALAKLLLYVVATNWGGE